MSSFRHNKVIININISQLKIVNRIYNFEDYYISDN